GDRVEEALLAHIYARSTNLGADVVVGPGDDAAVIRCGRDLRLITVDQVIEGRHVASDTPLDRVAHKAIARSVSDITAMGGTCLHALATAALPDGFAGADALFSLMSQEAHRYGCPLIGGDIATTTGPYVLTVTVLGVPHPSRGPVLRSTARPGDRVSLSGPVGGSFESGRHLTFEPPIDEARRLCDDLGERLHAMMDVSDGVGLDATRLARASGCGIRLDASRLPMAIDDWKRALADGEDHVLLFTHDGDAPGTVIGEVTEAPDCVVIDPDGGVHDASSFGWIHGSAQSRHPATDRSSGSL
ncbi:MAG: thiamine-monophosphate kinase, partial [Phycisphaerales bacterium]|nr:thiamine-monophosphate kinase [Phycisphaerales bacterium]